MPKTKHKSSISVGLKGGDIPLIPPQVALGLCAVSTVLAYFVGNYPFLPLSRTSQTIAILRILYFVAVVVISKKIKSLSIRELEMAKSGAHFTPVNGLATSGEVYSRTRNPLYVILVWIMTAVAVLVNSTWFLLASLLLWAYIQIWVIPVEERFLKRRFGQTYENYCNKTPRWVYDWSILPNYKRMRNED